jgi:hypothetical protein
MVALLLKNAFVPESAPPVVVRVEVLPTSRLVGTETVIADWVLSAGDVVSVVVVVTTAFTVIVTAVELLLT